ncbi:ATP-binding protein [Amycolatopsis mediterranei]|nr:ATP-binding protein [Amycolatopsis mediterranei]UZF73387.1 ATP-binding protein [Amycolatopsis mediterranei]
MAGHPHPIPGDINGQTDLAAAMKDIWIRSGMSYQNIATKSASLPVDVEIGKTTVMNIVTAGRSLPTEKSLRGFLLSCAIDTETVDEWCEVLRGLRVGQVGARPVNRQNVNTAVLLPLGNVWKSLSSQPLFEQLARTGSPSMVLAVKELVDQAVSILDIEYETAASYTLHGSEHSVSVVRRLGQLLGSDVRKLNAHESGILVVGAFFHDLGRVPGLPVDVSPSQVRRFLDKADGSVARLEWDDGRVPKPVMEDYCRWDRTRRLAAYTRQLPPELLEWDGLPMREALGVLCAEQACPRDKSSSPAGIPGLDIALCSGLLRLATRLELCDVRPAHDIYRRLGIERRSVPRQTSDDVEWRRYVLRLELIPKRRSTDYLVEVEAITLRSVVEYDLRATLDGIQEEFRRCQRLRTKWGEKWQRLPLPSAIDLAKLSGLEYTYEELRFELVRDDVLQLLGGTKLYGNPNVFVRELLQNAIDAVRLRNILDIGRRRGTVAISCWEDQGSIWFRIDDDGIGMDLQTIREYFLQVGRSYYNSEDLNRELRTLGRSRSRFSAISRFGIGIMSCFMLGDRIEVSTRKYQGVGEPGTALRLSVDRREDFATLRQDDQGSDPIPAGPGMVPLDFREDCGTTVAVRINAARHYVPPQVLLRYAEFFHFTNECTLFLNGKEHFGVDLTKPILDGAVFTHKRLGKKENSEFTARHLGRIRVDAIPLDISSRSPEPRIQGQLVAIMASLETSEQVGLLDLLSPVKRSRLSSIVRDALAATSVGVEVSADLSRVRLKCKCIEAVNQAREALGIEKRLPRDEEEKQAAILRQLTDRHESDFTEMDARVLAGLDISIEFEGDYDGFGISVNVSSVRWWGHNGVTLPVKRRNEFLHDDFDENEYLDDTIDISRVSLSGSMTPSGRVFLVGNVSLMDDLRPDLSLARDELEDIPFVIPASLLLALRRAIPMGLPEWLAAELDEYSRHQHPLDVEESVDLGPILAAVSSIENGWWVEPVLTIGDAQYTIEQAKDFVERRQGPVILHFSDRPWGYFPRAFDLIGAALAQKRLNMRWRAPAEAGKDGSVVAIPGPSPVVAEIMEDFPPLCFMYHEDEENLCVERGPWNAGHPLCAWFISRGAELKKSVPGHFSELRQIFRQRSGDALFHYARAKEKQGVIDLESLLVGYSADDYMAYGDDLDQETATRVALALVGIVVDRVVAAAPDLRPPAEVMELLGV